MGKSVDAADLLDRILVEGMKPNSWELHELGMDAKYLQKIVDKMKDRLWELPNFRPLKEAAHSGYTETRRRRFVEASYADVPCVRLTQKSYSFSSHTDRPFYRPFLGLNPVGNSALRHRQDIELFITGVGEWILYRDGDTAGSVEDSFVVCKTVEDLRTYLDDLCGATHVLSPPKYGVLVDIANWLIKVLEEDIDKLKKRIHYAEATVSECKELRDRLNFK